MKVGFIGLGVMGEPMCRNLARKSGANIIAHDRLPEPLTRLAAVGVTSAGTLADLAGSADIIFLSLPSGQHVSDVCRGKESLLDQVRPGTMVADLGTTSVSLTRELGALFETKQAHFVDAPIARTRQAAEEGTLSIMVGANNENFARLRPLLAHMASDITHCGPLGSGQIAKIMNNMVLVQTVVALSEALATARRAGMDGAVLFDVLSKGSADSFALRNHGMKALLPGQFPTRAFSVEYALKDLRYALDLAKDNNIRLSGAELAASLLEKAIAAGHGALYWPVVERVIDVNPSTTFEPG
jgi:3-hydroxyisobutyrate dehydrogenase-like beta-hydroxyacid dehydrogenase